MTLSKIAGLRHATVKEVRELSKLPWVRDEALSDRAFEARILPDGRVLMYLGDGERANVYPSRAAVEQMKRESAEWMAKQPKGPVDHTQTLLPPIADFLRDVDAHAKSLGPRLKLPDDVLDRSEASLDAVDKALKRIPWTKRQVPDLITPLVAYVGEVMLRVSGGKWSRAPTAKGVQMPVYDPAELAAWNAAQHQLRPYLEEVAKKAASDAKARGASKEKAQEAAEWVRAPWLGAAHAFHPKPIRIDVIDEPARGHENEPMITAHDGQLLQPFALVFLPMVEPSRRIPLRAAVEVMVVAYRPGFKGRPGTLFNPVPRPMPKGSLLGPDPSKVS